MNESSIKYIISRLVSNANDALEEENDDFGKGKKLAYYEMLDTLKNELIIHDQDLKEYGLDIDLDKKYV